METKVNFKAEKKNYTKGSVVILQGSGKREIHFLHSGSIEIKRSGGNIRGLTEEQILKGSKRIGVVEAPSIFGVQNLINSSSHNSSYIALNDCSITKYIIPSNDFIGFFRMNPPISLNILLTMQDQAVKNLITLKKFVDFNGVIEKVSDNLRLLYTYANKITNDELYNKFIKNGGVFPPKIEPSLLTSDFSTQLEKTYQDVTYNPKKKFEGDKIDFFRYLLKTKSAAFISLLANEIKIFLYMFENLSRIITELNNETERFASKIEKKLDHFFLEKTSPFNLVVSSVHKIKKSSSIDSNVSKAIVKICRNIEHINKQLVGREYIEIFPKYDILNKDIDGKEASKKVVVEGKFKKMFKNSPSKILSFSTFTEEQRNKVLKNLTAIKKINMEDSLNKDSRRIITLAQDDFFELYLNLFLKVVKSPNTAPLEVKLFLYFAFFDEDLLTEEQLMFLNDSLKYFTSPQETEYPIITLYDYMVKIYNSDEEPSLSERGEFRKLVTKVFSKNEKPVEDTPAGRSEFEIFNMVNNSMRITSNNMRGYIPYLSNNDLKGSISQLMISPRKLDAYIKKIVSIDYSLFYRELTWKIPGKSELIKKRVDPYLILIPNAGIRIQMWQEMVYNLRSTKARFLIPIFFNTDLNKELIYSCGHFRWNLNKSIVGNWMDPVDGGLTGAYYDYEMSYKKMTDLSIEAKEKIKKQINSIKIDRNRFAHDYFEWVTYESQGVPKTNKVLRKILFRLVPFTKEIREKISKLPVYMELNRKFEIIRNRDFKKLEARMRKYKENDVLPEDLDDYLKLMQR